VTCLVVSREQMKGSVMDAMADAVDEADVVLFCVSLAYKESGAQHVLAQTGGRVLRVLVCVSSSANCRLEANCESSTAVRSAVQNQQH